MPLTSGRDMLRAARAGGYAVPALNVFNLEMLQAACRAAEAERAPLIVQISPRSVAYAGLRSLAALARALADETTIPVALHLDHGPDRLSAGALRLHNAPADAQPNPQTPVPAPRMTEDCRALP